MLDRPLKIAMLQDRPGADISGVYWDLIEAKSPDILALPEYFFVGKNDDNVLVSSFNRDRIVDRLLEISGKLKCILIGGSLVEHIEGCFFNRSYIFDSGEIIGHYDKIHPFDNEGRGLINPGIEYKVFTVRGVKIGIMICADVLYPSSFYNIRGLTPDLIFVPTTSPYRKDESPTAKFKRDMRLFGDGARVSDSYIFKVCASGWIARHRVQGRSLIASPGKIEWRIDPEDEHRSALVFCRLEPDGSRHQLDIEVHRE